MKRKDLTGNKYGHLTVVEMLYGYNGGRHTHCKCVCDCGNETIVSADHIQKRENMSCGCMTTYYRSLHNRTNEIGNTYGYLTIVDIDYSKKPSIAKCECKCGNIIYVNKADVVSYHTQSCGCLQRENTSKANTKDYSGYVAETGVIIVDKHSKVDGVWYYNCICPLCGNDFVALPARVFEGTTTSCGCKISSSKERIISSILDNLNVKYEKQKRFKDCKYKYTLPFDFAIYQDDKLICLIEYDGEQHFRPVDFFGGKEGHNETIIRDQIKNEYCIKNNIKLIRLNYKDSIEEIRQKIINIFYP